MTGSSNKTYNEDSAAYNSIQNIEDSDIEQVVDSKTPTIIPMIYYISAGLLTLAIYFSMLVQTDDFLDLFPSQDYSFQVIIPQYFSIPMSFLVTRLMQSFSLKTKLISQIIFSSFFYALIPLVPIFLGTESYHYYIMMTIYLISYSGAVCL